MSTNDLSTLSVQQLKRALVLREKIDALQHELAGLVGGSAKTSPTGRRTMSPAARAKIAAAQKLRWAKQRKADKTDAAPKAKRKMSPAARKKIAAAARARWAKAKAANRNSLAA